MIVNVVSQPRGRRGPRSPCRARTRRARRRPLTSPSARWVKNGCLRGLPLASVAVGDFCHSYQPSRRHEAAPRTRRPWERRLLQHRLGPGVDHPHADLDVLGPARHQPPGEQPQLAHGRRVLGIASSVSRGQPGQHDRRLLGGRHVVVGLPGGRVLRACSARCGRARRCGPARPRTPRRARRGWRSRHTAHTCVAQGYAATGDRPSAGAIR